MLEILPKLEKLVASGTTRIILSSQSIRRREILQANVLGPSIPFLVRPSSFEENWNKTDFAGREKDYPVEYSREKASNVEQEILVENAFSGIIIIIGCDTVILQDGRILEKPSDNAEAAKFLRSYNGRSHSVVTGVCVTLIEVQNGEHNDENHSQTKVIYRKQVTSRCETLVSFRSFDEETIENYVGTGEPIGKAGGYAIQGLGACLVRSVNGCYFNVVGMPASLVGEMISSLVKERFG